MDWDVITKVLEILVAFLAGMFGSEVKMRIRNLFSGNKIGTKDTTLRQHNAGNYSLGSGATFGNVSGGTINVFGLQGANADYQIAEVSSNVVTSRFINLLRLTEQTIIDLPQVTRGVSADAILRIDTGDVVYPLGVKTDENVFDALCSEWLQLAPNTRHYLTFTYIGDAHVNGRIKHVWLVARPTVESVDGIRKVSSAHNLQQYGKLTREGKLVFADTLLQDGDVLWGNATSDMMLRHGLRIIDNCGPGSCDVGFYWQDEGWIEDGDSLRRQFKLCKQTPLMSDDENSRVETGRA